MRLENGSIPRLNCVLIVRCAACWDVQQALMRHPESPAKPSAPHIPTLRLHSASIFDQVHSSTLQFSRKLDQSEEIHPPPCLEVSQRLIGGFKEIHQVGKAMRISIREIF